MATIRASAVKIYARSIDATRMITGFPIAAPGELLTGNDANLIMDPIVRMRTIVELTGIGVTRRQRRDAALADIGSNSLNGLLDTADPNGLFHLLNGADKTGRPFVTRAEYGAVNATIDISWLINSFEFNPTVGTFVMIKGSLDAEGSVFDLGSDF